MKCVLLESSPLLVAFRSQSGASTGFEFGQCKDNDQVQGYRDCLNSLISAPTMVGGKDALKHSISKLILPEKTWKGTKTVFFKI